jgi:hypothetical protein
MTDYLALAKWHDNYADRMDPQSPGTAWHRSNAAALREAHVASGQLRYLLKDQEAKHAKIERLRALLAETKPYVEAHHSPSPDCRACEVIARIDAELGSKP